MYSVLIDAGAQVNQGNDVGDTPAYFVLVNHADKNARSVRPRLLLDGGAKLSFMEIAEYGTPDHIRMAVKRGADINESEPRPRPGSRVAVLPQPPLFWGAALASDPEIVRAMLEAGAEPNVTYGGLTALSFARKNSNKDAAQTIIRILQDAGTVMSAGDYAELIQTGTQEEVAKALSSGFANHDVQALSSILISVVGEKGCQPETARLLLKAGADINAKDNNGKTLQEREMPQSAIRDFLRKAGNDS